MDYHIDMDIEFPLSLEEAEGLEPALALLAKRSGRGQTLNGLLGRWNKFISQIESRYRLTIDDYTNELCIGDFLQVILDNCPKSAHGRLIKQVASMDDRLIRSSKKVEKPLLPALHGDELGWWWYRIPFNPGKAMERSLQNWWSE